MISDAGNTPPKKEKSSLSTTSLAISFECQSVSSRHACMHHSLVWLVTLMATVMGTPGENTEASVLISIRNVEINPSIYIQCLPKSIGSGLMMDRTD